MFKKKPQEIAEKTEVSAVAPVSVSPLTENETIQVKQTSRRNTVIAQDTLFTGNIEMEGDIHIYGKVQGNITLKEGVLYVMRDGFIEGEFTAPSLVINGRVQGTCTGDSVEVHEHGEMEGMIRSVAFSIRPGGSFVGKSERLAVKKEAEPKRVVEINKKKQSVEVTEKTVEEATVLSQAQ